MFTLQNSPLMNSASTPQELAAATAQADKEVLAMRAKKAFDLLRDNKPEEAMASATRALELAERSCGHNSVTTAKCHRLLAIIALDIGSTADADRHFDEVQQIDEALAKHCSGLASPSAWQAQGDQCVKSMQSSSKQEWLRDICTPSPATELDAAPDPTIVLVHYWQDMIDRGTLCTAKGDADRAEKYFRKAMEIPVSGNAGPKNLFSALARRNLAGTLATQERFQEAEAVLRDSDDILILAFGRESELGASVIAARGMLQVQKDNYAEARKFLQEAISICEDIKQPRCPTVGGCLVSLSLCSLGEDDPAAAEAEAAKGAAILKEVAGDNNPQFLFASNVLAEIEKWHSEREWRSATGTFSRRGRLIQVTDTAVVRIKEKESGVLEIAADRLSQEDQAFILEYAQSFEGEEQDPFVSVPK
jgi:tetratricopeptide (TPR) repeat protein